MYAARPRSSPAPAIEQLNDEYFTQTLLPDYMDERRELTADWNVVFDARGNFVEPHTEKRVPLGTLNVRDYLAEIRASHGRRCPISTSGSGTLPDNRPAQPLRRNSVHREGRLHPLFEAVQLAERYDLPSCPPRA